MINKIKALVVGQDINNYHFIDKDSGENFSVPISVVHEIVDFPSYLINDDGRLRTGSVIDMVVKIAQEDEIRYYFPSIKVYPRKSRPATSALQTTLASSLLLFLEHLEEFDTLKQREIVKAISTHDDERTCTLINEAIFNKTGD